MMAALNMVGFCLCSISLFWVQIKLGVILLIISKILVAYKIYHLIVHREVLMWSHVLRALNPLRLRRNNINLQRTL